MHTVYDCALATKKKVPVRDIESTVSVTAQSLFDATSILGFLTRVAHLCSK